MAEYNKKRFGADRWLAGEAQRYGLSGDTAMWMAMKTGKEDHSTVPFAPQAAAEIFRVCGALDIWSGVARGSQSQVALPKLQAVFFGDESMFF